MGKKNGKKQTKRKTPQRKSTRIRTRTSKGMYHDGMYCEESDDTDTFASNSVIPSAECATPVLDIENPAASQADYKAALCGATPAVLESETPNSSTSVEVIIESPHDDTLVSVAGGTPLGIMRVEKDETNLKRELELAESACSKQFSPEKVVTGDTGDTVTVTVEDKLLDNRDIHQLVDHDVPKVLTSSSCESQADELESLHQLVIKKSQELKIANDRIKQLEDSNSYRKVVTRLEEEMEENKKRKEEIIEMLEKERTEKVKLIGEIEKKNEEKLELLEVLDKKDKDVKILEIEKGKVMAELEEEHKEKHKALFDKEKGEKELEESNSKMQELKVEMRNIRENCEKELEESNSKMEELQVQMKKIQEEVIILKENKTFLLNENTLLKNEAKVMNQNKSPDEEPLKSQSVPLEPNNRQEQLNTAMCKELSSLQKELDKFKRFTFRRLDELSGRGGSSSLSSSSSGDQESESEGAQELQTKRTSPKRRLSKKGKTKQDEPPYVLRYEGNNPTTAALSPDETGRVIPVVPGQQSYSEKVRGSTASPQSRSDFDEEEKAKKIKGIKDRREARESKTLIFSSSITRDITRQQKSFNELCKKSDVRIHEFKGKRASDIVKYMIPHLEDEQPSSVVFVAGGNDLPNRDLSMDEIRKTASCLIEGGLVCRGEHGVNNVYISSVMPRSDSVFQGNRHRLNKMLREMCAEFNFIFIDNNNIVLSTHGHHDGIHLNYDGSNMLRDNLLSVLNS